MLVDSLTFLQSLFLTLISSISTLIAPLMGKQSIESKGKLLSRATTKTKFSDGTVSKTTIETYKP